MLVGFGLQEALQLEMQSCQMEISKGRSPNHSKDKHNFDRPGANSIAVASTLQQLGRVEIRRGQLNNAQQYLHVCHDAFYLIEVFMNAII